MFFFSPSGASSDGSGDDGDDDLDEDWECASDSDSESSGDEKKTNTQTPPAQHEDNVIEINSSDSDISVQNNETYVLIDWHIHRVLEKTTYPFS